METSFTIVAISPSEGRAIVREPGGLFAVQAPFRSGDRYPVSERTLQRALNQLDFETASIPCKGLAEVCEEIKAASKLHWKDEARSPSKLATDILKHADVWIVTDYLNALVASIGSTDRAVLHAAALDAFGFDALSDENVRELIRSLVEKTKPNRQSVEVNAEVVAPRTSKAYEHREATDGVSSFRLYALAR